MFSLRLSVAAFLVSVSTLCFGATKPAPQLLVVGYVFPQDAALQAGEIDAANLTRINYAFANIADGQMVTGFKADAQNFAYLTALRKTNPSLTVLVSVGGWLWSTNFSDVSLTSQSRKLFIDSVMSFLTQYDLDGLDIDWEYPGMEGSGHPYRAEDKENFTYLLKELRERFTEQTSRTHRRLYLTIAAGASDEFLAHTEMQKVAEYVDTVNLMAYDYYEPDSDGPTGNHAPLFPDPKDPRKVSGDASVKAYEAAGVPAAKILLGVPFYGHEWGGVEGKNHGLFQPGKVIPKADASYSLIAQTMLNHGFTRYWDAASSVPYLYNADSKVFVSYEDTESIAVKGKYVRQHNLGGLMFWEYSGDPSGTLLRAIDQSLGNAKTTTSAVK